MKSKAPVVLALIVGVIIGIFLLRWIFRLATAAVVVGLLVLAGVVIYNWLMRNRSDR